MPRPIRMLGKSVSLKKVEPQMGKVVSLLSLNLSLHQNCGLPCLTR